MREQALSLNMIKDTQTNPGGKSRAEAAMNRSNQQHPRRQQNISGDIIEDMLVSLPVESLLWFKWIFKSWHSLVNKPCFSRANFRCCRCRCHHHSYSNIIIYPNQNWTFQPPDFIWIVWEVIVWSYGTQEIHRPHLDYQNLLG